MSVFGLINFTSGIFMSSRQLSGTFSMYRIISYEKYPIKREQRGGRFLGKGKLKSSISLFKNM